MSKQAKKFYRALAWFFSVVVATGTLVGCATKYGPPPGENKYGPPPTNGYSDVQNKTVAQNDGSDSVNYIK